MKTPPPPPPPPPSRRDTLRVLGSLAALGPLGLPRLAEAALQTEGGRRLVLLYLEGGNDGLNTVVPFEDDRYHRARPRLRLDPASVLRLDEQTGLHPGLAPLEAVWKEGRMAVLRDVGYPRPDRSHFVSRDIWHCGRRELPDPPTGFLGRAWEEGRLPAGALPPMALGEAEAPRILRGTEVTGLTLRDLDSLALKAPPGGGLEALRAAAREAEAAGGLAARIARTARASYETSERIRQALERVPGGDDYPGEPLAARLRLAARLLRIEGGPPVVWLRHGGFDTHAVQSGTHAALLGQLGRALAAFLRDLATDGTDRRTLVLVYSEFGRRVQENGSQGTDHGAAGPVLAFAGEGLQAGFHGQPPDLDDLQDGDLRHQFDCRQLFREILEDWLGVPARGLFDAPAGRTGLLAS